MTARQAEVLASCIVSMDRAELVQVLRDLDCSFELDFSDESLDEMDIGHLQHIVLAATIRAKDAEDVPE